MDRQMIQLLKSMPRSTGLCCKHCQAAHTCTCTFTMPLAHGHPCQTVHCMFTSDPIHQAVLHAQAGHSQLPAGLFPAVPLAQSASLVFSDRFWRCDSLAQKARAASACLEPLHICPWASMVPASVICELTYTECSLLDFASYVCWAHQAFSDHEL